MAARAPRSGKQSEELGWETLLAAGLAFLGPDRQALHHFVQAVRPLRWSNRKLARLVHDLDAESALAEVPLPNLCGDWKAWVTSGYRTLSSGTTSFVHVTRLLVAESGESNESVEGRILRLLARYESAAEKRVARDIKRLEGLEEKYSESNLAAELKVFQAVGLTTTGQSAPPRAG